MARLAIRWIQSTDTARPFERSIELLLSLASRTTAADSCFLYALGEDGLALRQTYGASSRKLHRADIELSAEASAWLLQASQPFFVESNVTVDRLVSNFPEVLLHGFKAFAVVPLRLNDEFAGALTLGWKDEAGGFPLPALKEIGDSLALLLSRRETPAELAQRVAHLQVELADRKIADRVNGLLSTSQESADVVRAHVDKVLSTCDLPGELQQRAAELEEQIADRELLFKAKTLLQRHRGITEEQAYLEIRTASRRSRVRLRDVANAVVETYEPARLSA